MKAHAIKCLGEVIRRVLKPGSVLPNLISCVLASPANTVSVVRVLFSIVDRIGFVDKQLVLVISVLGSVVSRLFDTIVSGSSLSTGYSVVENRP